METSTIDLLYREYVRIHGVIDSMTKSSFDDFKLLATIGFMFAWKPLADRIVTTGSDDEKTKRLVFAGFAAVLLVIGVIATRDLMKQSIIFFNVEQAGKYETTIHALLAEAKKDELAGHSFFEMNKGWASRGKSSHLRISICFKALILIPTFVFPVIVLWRYGLLYIVGYIAIWSMVVGVYAFALLQIL